MKQFLSYEVTLATGVALIIAFWVVALCEIEREKTRDMDPKVRAYRTWEQLNRTHISDSIYKATLDSLQRAR
jgi:hypothetical protein